MTTFYSTRLAVGDIELGEEAAHHAKVRRLSAGDRIEVTDGAGGRGTGTIISIDKKSLVAGVEAVDSVSAPRQIHLLVPVADRERMLWVAEKATELQIASWTPVMYRRSHSVTPRGEGEAFDRKVRARMVSALEQSGGAWLPEIRPMIETTDLGPLGESAGFVLERGGQSLSRAIGAQQDVALAVGPEGGFEKDELGRFGDAGWKPASLGDTILRFETAAVAAVAVVRAMTE